MIKKICLIIILAVVPVLLSHQNFALADAKSSIKGGISSTNNNAEPSGDINGTIKEVISLLSLAVGVAAVVMMIIGGFRYVTSSGNAEGTKNARNTILYAVIGLVVAAMAQILVRFVLNETKK